jgi:glycosyltransferase family protein
MVSQELIKKIKASITFFVFGVIYPFYRFVFGKPKVLSVEQTINELINRNLSIARFGDSEFRFMLGKGDRLQVRSELLRIKLIEVLKNKNPNLLLCIVDYTRLNEKTFDVKSHHLRSYFTLYIKVKKYFLDNYTFGDANMTRFYMNSENDIDSEKYFEMIKKIWHDKEIVIFEGEFTRFGYGNDLFANTKSIQRVLCPSKQAFDVLEDIFAFARTLDKNKQLLFALGATATICASELSNEGYQVLDIGNLDIEYEWFKRKLKKRVAIENKQVYEALNNPIDLLTDETYYSQIIARIGV